MIAGGTGEWDFGGVSHILLLSVGRFFAPIAAPSTGVFASPIAALRPHSPKWGSYAAVTVANAFCGCTHAVLVEDAFSVDRSCGSLPICAHLFPRGVLPLTLPYHLSLANKMSACNNHVLVKKGITPMLQVLQELLFNPEDKTKVTLVFANQSPADIMLKAEIDKLAAEHDNFEVVYVVRKGRR